MKKINSWKPSASINNLLKRACIISEIRNFFSERKILEVDTPIMSQATTTDVHLVSFKTYFTGLGINKKHDLWLTTSPEFHMKRLLAAGMGAIYQLSHSFRNEEVGRYHNPEFSILEWYRPHCKMYTLMSEVYDLIKQILGCKDATWISYQKVFMKYLALDPLLANKHELFLALENVAKGKLVHNNNIEYDVNTLLQLLFFFAIEPKIGIDTPTFIYHFPVSQAGLAEVNTLDNRVAERFEVYYKGVELANGFQELTDRKEQYRRFQNDQKLRCKQGLAVYPIDNNFLDALSYGMPSCSGVALGVDRLIMLAIGATSLSEVIAFPIDRC